MEVVWLVDFHLPADTIPLQDLRGWEGQFGKRGEHDNVPRKLQGLRLYLLSFARGLLAYFVMRYPDRFFRFSDRTHPPRHHVRSWPTAWVDHDSTMPARRNAVSAASKSNGAP